MDGWSLRTKRWGPTEKYIKAGVRAEAEVAESMAENREGGGGSAGRRDGLAVRLSGKPIYQIKAPQIWGGGQSGASPGNVPLSRLIHLKKYLNYMQRQKKKYEQTTQTTWMRPRLSVSLEFRFP